MVHRHGIINYYICPGEDGSMLELSTQDRTESLALWRERETRVNMAIVNCALNCHNYTLACDLLNDLLRRTEEELEKVKLSAALGEKEGVFQPHYTICTYSNVSELFSFLFFFPCFLNLFSA